MTNAISTLPVVLNGPVNKAHAKKLAAATTEELRSELATALKLTADHLVRLALVWVELERRGEDLSPLRNGIGKYLPKIAAGTVLAETVVAFAGEPLLLSRVAALPIAKQKEAVDTGSLPESKNQVDKLRKEFPVRSTVRKKTMRIEKTCQQPVIKIEEMAAAGSAQDVAEMCLKMIRSNSDPKDVAQRLAPEIENIIKRKKSALD